MPDKFRFILERHFREKKPLCLSEPTGRAWVRGSIQVLTTSGLVTSTTLEIHPETLKGHDLLKLLTTFLLNIRLSKVPQVQLDRYKICHYCCQLNTKIFCKDVCTKADREHTLCLVWNFWSKSKMSQAIIDISSEITCLTCGRCSFKFLFCFTQNKNDR